MPYPVNLVPATPSRSGFVWGFATAAAASATLAWVKLTRVGPVLMVIDDRRGWGIHTGDLIVAVPAGLICAAAVIAGVTARRRG